MLNAYTITYRFTPAGHKEATLGTYSSLLGIIDDTINEFEEFFKANHKHEAYPPRGFEIDAIQPALNLYSEELEQDLGGVAQSG